MKKEKSLQLLSKLIYIYFFPLWMLMGILEVAEKYFTGTLVQWAIDDMGKVQYGILILAGLFLVNYLLSHFSSYLLNHVVESVIMKVREKLLSNVINTKYSNIEELTKGELLTKLMQNLKCVQDYEQNVLPGFIRSVTQGVLALIVCVLISPILASILFLSIPIIIIMNVLASVPTQSLIKVRNTIEAEQNTYAENRLENIKSIKIFSLEKWATDGYENYLNKNYSQNIKIANMRALLSILDGINYVLPYVLIFGGATILALKGKILVGEIVSFTYLMNFITTLMGSMQQFIYERNEKKDASHRISKILDLEVMDLEKLVEKCCQIEGVYLDNVSFSYVKGNKKNAVEGINIKITKGEKVAIVGESGSGKSTLLKLISGLYEQQYGTICISGKIACINQENFLLPISLAENIKGSNSSLTIQQVKEIAKKAGIDKFIESLPGGYNTIIDTESLSGGEAQRICIARSFAQDAEILLLDEPTSALDHSNEELLWEQLRKSAMDKTILMVTHSFYDMSLFDNIYVMDNGKIIELGTHQELYEKKGKYYDLWNAGRQAL